MRSWFQNDIIPKIMLYIPKVRMVELMGHGGCSNFSMKNWAWVQGNLQAEGRQGTQPVAGHTNQPKSAGSPT